MITTRAREGGPKEHRAKQKWPRETHSVTYVLGLSTLSDLLRINAQSPPSFLCCPMPPSHHPSRIISVSLVPALHLFLPSSPFRPYDTHPFIPQAQTISILSDLHYSLSPFPFQLSHTYLFIPISLSISDTPTKLLKHKHFISRTFTFLLLALSFSQYLASLSAFLLSALSFSQHFPPLSTFLLSALSSSQHFPSLSTLLLSALSFSQHFPSLSTFSQIKNYIST